MSVIREVYRGDTFVMHECSDGYYLYDYVVGVSISMRAKTEQDAYIEAIKYYQKHTQALVDDNLSLNSKLDSIIDILKLNED